MAVAEVGSLSSNFRAVPAVIPKNFVDLSAKLEEAIPKLQGHSCQG